MNWKHYSLLASAIITFKKRSDAQIQYTDIEDTTIANGAYLLDLNNDGIVHFAIKGFSTATGTNADNTSSTRISINPRKRNQVVAFPPFAKALDFDNHIDGGDYWDNDSLTLYNHFWWQFCSCENCSSCQHTSGNNYQGRWRNVDDRFLGLRLIQNTDTFYGWARLDVHRNEFTVKDYALEALPGKRIKAGELNCGTLAVSLPQGPFGICANGCATLTASAPFGYSIQWLKNNQRIDSANENSLEVCDTGNYSLVAYDKLLCRDTSNIVNFYWLEKPFITQGGDTLFSSSPRFNQWLHNDVLLRGANKPYYVTTLKGKFNVEVVGADGCVLVSDPLIISAVAEPVKNENPIVSFLAERIIQVQFQHTNFAGGKIKVINSMGQMVRVQEIHSNNLQISLKDVTAGWYSLEISKDGRYYLTSFLLN